MSQKYLLLASSSALAINNSVLSYMPRKLDAGAGPFDRMMFIAMRTMSMATARQYNEIGGQFRG